MGETTTTLDEEISTHDRQVIEDALHALLARGLVMTSRGTFAGVQRLPGGGLVDRVYDDDWWTLTQKGRVAIGTQE